MEGLEGVAGRLKPKPPAFSFPRGQRTEHNSIYDFGSAYQATAADDARGDRKRMHPAILARALGPAIHAVTVAAQAAAAAALSALLAADAEALAERHRTADAVLRHLEREESAAIERLEAARLELDVIRTQRAEQATKCEEVVQRQGELRQMEEIVGQTADSLEAERRKAIMLLRNFNPALADDLEAEFAF